METLLAALIGSAQIIIVPTVTLGSARLFRALLEYLDKPKPRYSSLDVAIAEIALGVRDGRFAVDDVDFLLNGFSEEQKNTALSILYKTEYLTILDVDFQEVEEQMLFCQVLASSVSSVHSVLNDLE
ncbi:hypothetical protein [Coleofasciculus sp. E1-EBD-02]|uniref:hypothetical protein n=1 Tax=Coleofasciculus sp. E1-EBD-02 TaxID=3068481 RepID=UPI0032FB7607